MKTLAILLIAVFGLAYGRLLFDEEARLLSLMEEEYQEKRAIDKVTIDQPVEDFYKNMLSTRNKYAILKINNENKVVIESMGESNDTTTIEKDEEEFNKMKDALPANEPRYVLYKFGFYSDVRNKSVKKIVFIYWDNPKATLGQDRGYASGKDLVKKGLDKDLYLFKFSSLKYFTYPKMALRVQWL